MPASQISTCPVCANRLDPYIREVADPVTGRQFDVLKCSVCGVGVTDPVPEQSHPHYAGYYGSRHGIATGMCVSRRIGLVSKMAGAGKGRRLLDVGCGNGSFLLSARASGWQVTGTELNPDLARRQGLDVYHTLSECAERGPFDCITLWHSLEHMPDPREVIAQLRKLVADDGLVLIAVPDFAGIQSETFRGSWMHLDVPRHLYHFTATSIDRMLNQTEFVPVGHWHQEFEYDLIGWWQSALNAVLPTRNVLFDFLTVKKLRGTLLERVVSGITALIFPLISLPLVWMGSFFRRGGTLLVAARASGRQLAGASGD